MDQPMISSVQDILVLVRVVVAEFLGVPLDEVRDDGDLRAHGADSIDRVEILLTLNRRLGLDTPLAAYIGIPHLIGLSEFLSNQARQR
jgi:acyl carrier protein